MSLNSPLTGNPNTNLVKKISVATIIEQYHSLNIDVSRFFNNTSEVEIHLCNDTHYRFYYPFTIFGDGKFYEELQTRESGYYVKNRWEHLKAIDLITHDKKVLEIGFGDGFFLDLLKRKNIESVGLELNAKAVEEARLRGLTVQTQLLEEFALENENKFDFVCSFHVLEHITDPRSFILDSLKVLKPGGKLIFAVPNNNPYLYKHDILHTLNLPPHHAGLWNREAFENLPKFFPFSLDFVKIDPLSHYKEWFQTQVKYQKKKNAFLGSILSLIPRPAYKAFLHLFRNAIEGRNMIAVFTKPVTEEII